MWRQRSRQAPSGNKEGWSWLLALCQQSCAVWYWKEGIWHHHMTKWPQFYSVVPSAEPNRSGHKEHCLCQEARPALGTKFVTASKFGRSGAWWCDLLKLVGMVLPEKQNVLLLDRTLPSVSDLPVSGWALWCYCSRLRWCFYIELKQLGALTHSSPQAWAVGRGGTCHCSHRAECSCSCGLGSCLLAHVSWKKSTWQNPPCSKEISVAAEDSRLRNTEIAPELSYLPVH